MTGREENDSTFYSGRKELFFPVFAYIPYFKLRLQEEFDLSPLQQGSSDSFTSSFTSYVS